MCKTAKYETQISPFQSLLHKSQTCFSLIFHFSEGLTIYSGFPCGSAGLRICLQCGRPGFDPWVGNILWRREKLPPPVFWFGEFHGLCSPWGCKELDRTEWLSPCIQLQNPEAWATYSTPASICFSCLITQQMVNSTSKTCLEFYPLLYSTYMTLLDVSFLLCFAE